MPTGILRRRAGVAVAVAAVLMSGLSACSDPAQPATLPTTKATTTAAPTTSTPEPLTPEEEVEQFIRDYFDELQHASNTLDSSRLSGLSTEGCPCFDYVRTIRGVKREGHEFRGITWTIDELLVREVAVSDALVGVKFRYSSYDVTDKKGEILNSFKGASEYWDFSLVKTQDGEWLIGNSLDLFSDPA